MSVVELTVELRNLFLSNPYQRARWISNTSSRHRATTKYTLRCTQCIMWECLLTILIYRALACVGRAANDKSGSRHSRQLHYVHSWVSRMCYGPRKQSHVASVFQNLRPPSRLAHRWCPLFADALWSRLLGNLLLCARFWEADSRQG